MEGLRLIEHCAEFLPKDSISKVPDNIRGIYVLLWHDRGAAKNKSYEVVYIGMSSRGVKGRLEGHRRSRRKGELWNFFSVYAVWANITKEEIVELEGLFRAIYRRDPKANKLAVQKGFKRLRVLQDNKFKLDWSHTRRCD